MAEPDQGLLLEDALRARSGASMDVESRSRRLPTGAMLPAFERAVEALANAARPADPRLAPSLVWRPLQKAAVALVAVLLAPASAAQPATDANPPAEEVEIREVEPLVAETPNDVSNELEQSRVVVDSLFGPGLLGPLHQVWNAGANWLEDYTNLQIGMNYTFVYQYGSRARDETHAAGGDFDLFGSWRLFDFEGRWPARLVFATEARHRAAPIPPAELEARVGSLWPTTVGFNVEDFSLVELYWDQGSIEDRARLRLGKIDPSNFLDSGRYVTSNLAFLNAAFSDTPTLPFPEAGFGLATAFYPTNEIYIIGSLQNANGDRTGTDLDSLGELELFYAVELGVVPGGVSGSAPDHYHLTLWHTDARKKEKRPSAYGVAITLEKGFGPGGNIVPFLRYSWSSDAATSVEQLVAVGVGFEEVFGQNRDVIGLGFSWGRPHDRSRPDQYVAEAFYRFFLTERTSVTPDVQLIVNPSLAPSRRNVWLFGLRLRTVF